MYDLISDMLSKGLTINGAMVSLLTIWLLISIVKVCIDDMKMDCPASKELPRRNTKTGDLNYD